MDPLIIWIIIIVALSVIGYVLTFGKKEKPQEKKTIPVDPPLKGDRDESRERALKNLKDKNRHGGEGEHRRGESH